jgi:arsenate reductase
MVKIYGIPNCDTVKKTLDFFKAKKIAVQFHNYKTEGISDKKLKEWFGSVGINKVVNKVSSTYKKLSEEQKIVLDNPETAILLLQEFPSIIKRPIVEHKEQTLVGFKKDEYEAVFQ